VDEEIKEELLIPPPEEIPEEIEISKEEIAIAPQETLKEIQSLEEVVVSPTEELPEELVSPEPKDIKCPFCAFKIDTDHRFCPQCGYLLKK